LFFSLASRSFILIIPFMFFCCCSILWSSFPCLLVFLFVQRSNFLLLLLQGHRFENKSNTTCYCRRCNNLLLFLPWEFVQIRTLRWSLVQDLEHEYWPNNLHYGIMVCSSGFDHGKIIWLYFLLDKCKKNSFEVGWDILTTKCDVDHCTLLWFGKVIVH
jgi:hypothetical protein